MAKFNLNNLSGGMLNASSKTQVKKTEYPMIEIENIIPNAKNQYEINDIEELAFSIKNAGLQQNLVVRELEDGRYSLLTGHRRLEALKMIVNAKEPGWEQFTKVPCMVQRLDDINLPLDDDDKELYAIITTNAEQRNKSAADLMLEVEALNSIYDKLKEKGIVYPGKRRDNIAQQLGVSPAQVHRVDFISKNATDEVKEHFQKGELDLASTTELAKLPTEVQEKIISTVDKEVDTNKEVKAKVREYKEETLAKIENNQEINSIHQREDILDTEDDNELVESENYGGSLTEENDKDNSIELEVEFSEEDDIDEYDTSQENNNDLEVEEEETNYPGNENEFIEHEDIQNNTSENFENKLQELIRQTELIKEKLEKSAFIENEKLIKLSQMLKMAEEIIL